MPAQLPFTFLPSSTHDHHANVFSRISLEQAALKYAHYCGSLMLTITLNPWSLLLIRNLNWTVWFPMIESVTHVTRWHLLTQICRLTWPSLNTGKDCCLYYTSSRHQYSIDLLCKDHLMCTTATHDVNTVVRIYMIITVAARDFCLHFNKLLYKK